MAQVIMNHRVFWCFGTRLAPNYPNSCLTELGKVVE